MILHLGVLDLPYADAASYKAVKRRKPKSMRSEQINTGDVAEILEAQYGIMEFFYDKHGSEIADWVVGGLEKSIESIELGAPLDLDAFGEAGGKIEERFRDFLTNKEMDNLVAGVPTLASLEGHSRRFKKPSAKRKSRPSFVDTGLFSATFRAWTDE